MDLRSTSFTKALEEATQSSKWQDTITDYCKSLQQNPNLKEGILELTFLPLKHQLFSSMEFNSFIYYFFTNCYSKEQRKGLKEKMEFSLIIYSFNRQDGTHNSAQFTDLKGTPSCIAPGISSYLKDASTMTEADGSANLYHYKMVVLVGLRQGFTKIIELNVDKDEKALKPSVFSHKLQQKPIVNIEIAEKHHFEQKNISFILFEDNKTYIFNYVSKQVICVYQPPILGHDHAVGFALHCSGKYFASCSRSGQITFWEVNENALKAIARSEDKIVKISNRDKSESIEDDIEEETWSFKPKDRVVSVFPMTTLHSASIKGLKWIGFMGNLLALISSQGLFRLIAVNFQIRDQFIILIEYQISNGAAISSVQLLPHEESLIVFKGYNYLREFEDSQLNGGKKKASDLTLQDLTQRENLLRSKDNYYRYNYNSLGNCVNERNCVERISFDGDLRIKSVSEYAVTATTEDGQRVLDRELMRFQSGVVTENRNIVMCRSDRGIFIGLFQNLSVE